MSRKTGGYSALFERIEREFNISDLTEENLKEFLVAKPGDNRTSLAEQIASANIIYNEIDDITDINELNQLYLPASKLIVKEKEVQQKITQRIEQLEIERRERLVAESVARGIRFAKEKGRVLNEKNIYREENWKGKKVKTLRNNKGRFISWKRI